MDKRKETSDFLKDEIIDNKPSQNVTFLYHNGINTQIFFYSLTYYL